MHDRNELMSIALFMCENTSCSKCPFNGHCVPFSNRSDKELEETVNVLKKEFLKFVLFKNEYDKVIELLERINKDEN